MSALATTQQYTPIQGARWMAKQGLRITPLSGKIAVTKGWQDSATQNTELINAWAKNRSDYNYGCVFKKGEFWAVDEDIAGVIDRFTAESGIIIDTLHVQSSTGRFHWYFKASPESDEILKNITQAQFKDGAASVRVQNEYCVAPFSVHPEKNTAYLPVDINAPIKPAPVEFIKWLLAQQVQPEQTAKSAAQDEGPIPDGQRDNVLTAIAGTWRQAGLEYEEIYPALSRVNQERCKPPKPEEDVVRIAKSVCRYPKGYAGPTVLIGGKLPGQAVAQPNHSQQNNVEIIPAGKFKNPVKVKKSLAEYPLWVWEGTIFEEIAEACGKDNFIPREFVLEAIKTITGAVCGHRIQPQGARGQQPSRWYSILIGPGGIGKSTAVNWLLDMFIGTGLLCELQQELGFVNIGRAKGSFASDSGMKKNGFAKHARILQVYDEISILIEKFSITGSGGSFLDTINQMFEYCPVYPQMSTKDDKLTNMPSREAHNSILGCTTPLRWQNAFGKTNTEQSGFFQRLNIITNASGERVSELHPPDLSELRDRLVKKIQPLEYQMAEVVKTPEAIALQEAWHKAKRKEWENHPDDIKGRIETLLLRNISQISWLMSGEDVLPDASKSGQPIELVCDEDIIRRAIALAEYEIHARQFHRPIPGDNPYAILENSIERYFQENGGEDVNRSKLYKHLHAERYGELIYTKVLDGLVQRGTIKIGQREGDTRRGRKALVVMWLGEESEEE
jgi:Bifunctional DNA primase/polymerase, N-terminal/Primase C terminal 1 (PriCT-1)